MMVGPRAAPPGWIAEPDVLRGVSLWRRHPGDDPFPVYVATLDTDQLRVVGAALDLHLEMDGEQFHAFVSGRWAHHLAAPEPAAGRSRHEPGASPEG